MRLAISGQLLGATKSLAEILQIIRSLGVEAVELWPENLTGGDASDYGGKDAASARRLLEQSGIAAACITLHPDAIARCAHGGPKVGTSALEEAIEVAVHLGAPLVNCYLAGLPAKTFVEAMRPAAAAAGRAGISIVLENEAHDESGIPDGIVAIVEGVESRYFGTLYDPVNYYQANVEPFPAAYEAVRPFIRYVHLKGGRLYDPQAAVESQRGSTMRDSTHRFIGYVAVQEGVVNVDGLIRRLRSDGYKGFVTLEPHVPAQRASEYYQQEVPYITSHLREAMSVAGGGVKR